MWTMAYHRAVRSAFATVPFYRHRWALSGRTDPIMVDGRTGVHGGAVTAAEIIAHLVDLVPLSGGSTELDPLRGLRSVLASSPAAGDAGRLHDPILGYLGARRGCGHWHLDWRRVYARSTTGGLAFTLLRQHSPRLVDVLAGTGEVRTCPRHGTPILHGGLSR